jgi:hypothetical protein
MNELNKNKILQTRFENDAAQGFKTVHGAEEFFRNMKSPFNAPAPKPFWSSWGFVLIEIVMVAGLVVAGQYLNFDSPATAKTQLHVEVPVAVNVETVEPPMENMAEIVAPVIPKQTTHTQQLVLNKLTDPNPAIKTDTVAVKNVPAPLEAITKPDSVKMQDPVFTYIYKDNQAKYRMRYVEDLLVVNYSDTALRPKLNPYTNGTEAKYESKTNNDRLAPVAEFKMVENNDYLIKLARPLKAMQQKRYKEAMTSFKFMLKDKPADQNVLFYGALTFIEMGNHSKALVFLEKLKLVENPVFDEDPDWLLAKVYKELGRDAEAKAILKTIASSNSYYKNQAKAELKK